MPVEGGKKLEKMFRAGKGSIKSVEVGFYSAARYPRHYTGRGGGRRSVRKNPPRVVEVAAWNEFGTKRGGKQAVLPRPFLRPAFAKMRKKILSTLREYVDPKTMVVTKQIGGVIGLLLQNAVRDEIDAKQTPPLSPRTIRRKGSSKPLIDTGKMRKAVSWRVRNNR